MKKENKILKKFEVTDVTIEIIDGVPMFELYSTGMALGYVKLLKESSMQEQKELIKLSRML